MKFRPTLAAFGVAFLAAGLAVEAGADGDPESGKVLAYTCHGCHGVENYKNAFPNYSVPKLGGQNVQYLINALNAYANGERPHQTMHSQAATLTEQNRADIAAYLHGNGVQQSKEVVGTAPPQIETCVACHGADGRSTTTPDYPVLAGQHADYIVQALKDYKSGKRKNPIMAGMVASIDEKDFEAIAQFYASQKGLCGTDELRENDGRCASE
ncbi:MAG TPA: c-type cytochrome [Steroidobacter sp.]